jgi:monoterpene epsilon-lactone hydrolase
MSVHLLPILLRAPLTLVGRWMFAPHATWEQRRRRMELALRLPGAPRRVAISQTRLCGVPTELLRPALTDPDRVLLYFHGGGYAVGSPRTHRALVGRLAVALRAEAYVPDYRLAPEHRYPAAFDDCLAAYRGLLAAGWPADRIVVAGDSAGAGLALALGVAARERGLPLPSALGLLCPGIDLTPEGVEALPRPGREPVLTVDLLHQFGDAYAGREGCGDPGVSPLLAELAGLPPLVIDTAENDILAGQSRRLAQRARDAGVDVHYREHPGLSHGFHSLAGVLLQADRALRDVAAALNESLENDSAARISPRRDPTAEVG